MIGFILGLAIGWALTYIAWWAHDNPDGAKALGAKIVGLFRRKP